MKAKTKEKIPYIVAIVILIAIVIFLVLFKRNSTEVTNMVNDIKTVDSQVVDQNFISDKERKRQEDAKAKAKNGTRMTMSSKLHLNLETQKIDLNMQNNSTNAYPQYITIRWKDSDVVIYKSGLIPVGSKLEQADCSTKMSKGTYECVATFNSYDEFNKKDVGELSANLTITVD